MKKALVIFSGGVDSTTLLYDVISKNYEVTALCFNYNQKHVKELNYAKRTCKKLNIPLIVKKIDMGTNSALTNSNIKIPKDKYNKKNMLNTVVPYRNLKLILEAAIIANIYKIDYLFYGAHGGDHEIYPDCRPAFINATRKVIKLADYAQLELKAPYMNKTKSQIVAIGKKLNVDYSLTWSCYEGKEEACGKCATCKERLEAFKLNKLKDPIQYTK